jgi:hypothetical protein
MSTVNQDARPARDPEGRRWERLEELFAAAADLPRNLQQEFVDRETAADPELGRQLRALLHCDTGAHDRITRAVDRAAKAAAISADWTGRRIGPYLVLREVGRGGMGMVFDAVRDDGEYSKTVALKIAPWWRDLNLLGERFRHERQILASLEHPNIARFLDGGTHQGIPYFAMEFVKGVPITRYAEEHGLKLRERVDLFRQVCAAVQYAHQGLVVHRDLKPGNILVTHEGVPKLLDFGIAKLLSPAEDGGGNTMSGGAPWTPDYASPEQVRARPVTTRTDVYSLGLVLYELLTGERGQVADTTSPLALDRSVCETEVPLASSRALARGDQALARQLRGDLDTIVATATRKEPERRYDSVADFSDDLWRYLRGLPVKARPGTAAYRAGKLIRRHRLVAAAITLVIAAVAGGVFTTIHQARRAERRSQQVRKLATSVLFGLQDRLQNLAGATETRAWAVRTALEYMDDLAKDSAQDRSVLAELATGYLKVGDLQGYGVSPNLGNREAALASFRKAEGIAERLDAQKDDADARRLLSRSHLRIAGLLRSFHRTAASIAEYRRALPLAEALYSANPTGAEDASLLSTTLGGFGSAQSAAGDLAEASRLWLRAADVSARAAEQSGDALRAQSARTGKYVIRAHMYSGDLEAAERLALEGVRVQERAAELQPGTIAARRNLSNAYGDLAYIYFHPAFLSYGDRRTAARYMEKSLQIARALASEDPSNATAQLDLDITEVDYCQDLNGPVPAQGIRYCRDSLALAAKWPQLSADEGLAGLADGLQRLGRLQEAREALNSAMRLREDLYRQDPEHFVLRQILLRGHIQMAGLLSAMRDDAGALEQNRQAVALAEELSAAIPTNLLARRDLADAYESLGRYFEHGDSAQARAWYQKSLDLWTAWPTFAHTGRMDQARRRQAQQAVARCR